MFIYVYVNGLKSFKWFARWYEESLGSNYYRYCTRKSSFEASC